MFVTFSLLGAEHFQSLLLCSTSASPLPVLTDHTGSEENIDISVLGLHSKLNLQLKPPLSHNHKPEAYPSRPGHSFSEQIHVDGGYLCDGVRVCVCVLVCADCVFLWTSLAPLVTFFCFLWIQSTMWQIFLHLKTNAAAPIGRHGGLKPELLAAPACLIT